MNEMQQPREPKPIEGPRRPHRIKVRRIIPVGLVGALVAIALLTMTSPLASAAGSVATFTPPYLKGTAVQVRDPVAQGCGASLIVKTAASFNLVSGKGVGWATVKSISCPTADSQSGYDGIVGVRALRFTSSVSGAHAIAAHWTVTWGATASMTAAAANAGAQATVEIYILVALRDITTSTTQYGKAFWIVAKDLQTAQSYLGGAVNALYTAGVPSATLTAGHSYALYVVMGFSAQAVVPAGSPAGAVVTAGIDLGSASHGALLSSIVVS